MGTKTLISADHHGGPGEYHYQPTVIEESIGNMTVELERMEERNELEKVILNGDLVHFGSNNHPWKLFRWPLAQQRFRPLGEFLKRSGRKAIALPGNWDMPVLTDEDFVRRLLSDETGKINLERPGMHYLKDGLFVTHGHTLPVSMRMFVERMFRFTMAKKLKKAGSALKKTMTPDEEFLHTVEAGDQKFHRIADMIALAKEFALRCMGTGRKLIDDWHEGAINDVYAGALTAGLVQLHEKNALPEEVHTAVFSHTHNERIWTREELQNLLHGEAADDVPQYVANTGTAGMLNRAHATALIIEPGMPPKPIVTWQPHIRDRVSTIDELPEYGRPHVLSRRA